jgi:hypothetical protein
MPTDTERPRLTTSTRKLVVDAYEAACESRSLEMQMQLIHGWCLGAAWDGYKRDARFYLERWALDDLRTIERADDDADIETILWPSNPHAAERE